MLLNVESSFEKMLQDHYYYLFMSLSQMVQHVPFTRRCISFVQVALAKEF
jgi:hypothetical protein